MTKVVIAEDWQCSLDLLNATIYRKYQHVSEHNPIKCGAFSIHKKKSPPKENMDPLYKNSLKFKLPQMCTNRIRHTMNQSKRDQPPNRQDNMFSFYNPKQSKNNSCIVTQSMNSTTRDGFHTGSFGKQYKERLAKFKQILFYTYKLGEKDRCFSYLFNMVNHICSVIQRHKDKQSFLELLVKDIQLLLQSFEKNKSFVSTIKKITTFKKQQKYFLFKTPQFKILFQALLAQLQMLQNNMDKTVQNFQFCEYHCRKNNMQELTICFLWEISIINVSLLKYQQADQNIRNLIQMAVITRKRKAIKYSLQKISLLYYYRGNSIMGQYYFKKSEQGLSNFEVQIYVRQYKQSDQVKRLQNKLFSTQNYQKIVKRKNNPKFEADIWRQSKQQYEQVHQQYMERVKKMLKTHESAVEGRKIKKMVAKIDQIGDIKNTVKTKQDKIRQNKKCNKQNNQNINIGQNQKNKKKSMRTLQEQYQEPMKEANLNKSYLDNVTRVIKTHLSMNREGATINRQQRWRKFTSFLISLEVQLKQMLQFAWQLKSTQASFNKTQF